jgi:hypothetical protein
MLSSQLWVIADWGVITVSREVASGPLRYYIRRFCGDQLAGIPAFRKAKKTEGHATFN